MPQDKPRYQLQVMVPSSDKARAERQSASERAKQVFRSSGGRNSETGSRVRSLLRQSDEMQDYDLYGANESARKAELLSRELRSKNDRLK